MWFSSWDSLLRVAVIGVFAYTALVVLLRVSGKRTLSKMNAFDFVVTVALGSTLASSILSKDVALLDAMMAFAVLIGLQFVVAWLAVRFEWFEHVLKSEPALVAYNGHLLYDALKRERVTVREVETAVREAGYPGVEAVDAVVLETDGQFSVITQADSTDTRAAVENVMGFKEAHAKHGGMSAS